MSEDEKITVNPDAITTVAPEAYPELQTEIDLNDRKDFEKYKKAMESQRIQCLNCSKWTMISGLAVCSDPPEGPGSCPNFESRWKND